MSFIFFYSFHHRTSPVVTLFSLIDCVFSAFRTLASKDYNRLSLQQHAIQAYEVDFGMCGNTQCKSTRLISLRAVTHKASVQD